MFITFEGLDYSGKTTQAKLLVDRLEQHGRQILFLREPGGTPISERIRAILLDKQHNEMSQKAELFLFSAARTQLVSQVIRPAIEKGIIVLCDRFYDSTTAYQGYGRGLDLKEVQALNTIATYGTSPDLTLFMNVNIDEVVRRYKRAKQFADRMEESGREFFERVQRGYLALAANEPGRFVVVDANKTIETVHNEIWNIVQQRLG